MPIKLFLAAKEAANEATKPDEPRREPKPTIPSNPSPHCCEIPVRRNDAPLSAEELAAVREHEADLIRTVERYNAGFPYGRCYVSGVACLDSWDEALNNTQGFLR